MYNPVVTFHKENSSKATIEAMVQAYHCLEVDGQVDSLTVRATWTVEMEYLRAKWFITDMSMARDIPLENPSLFQRMQEQMVLGNKREPATVPTIKSS